jgi:signal transduction histidine kinase
MKSVQMHKEAQFRLLSQFARIPGTRWDLVDPVRAGVSIAEQYPGILLATDIDLRITLVQGKGLADLGFHPHQLVSMPLEEFFQVEDADVCPLDVYRSALEGHSNSWEWAWKTRLFQGQVEPLVDSDGQTVGTITAALDITERQKSADKKLQEEIRHQEANKVCSLKALAGGVAHNFNNLLSAVMGYTSLALVELPLDSPVRGLLREVDVAAQCAADLAAQMLLCAQRTIPERRPVNLSLLIESLKPTLQASAGKKIVLVYDLAGDLPSIVGDPTLLRQVVMNLLRNAAESIGDGSGTIRLRTQVIHGDRSFFSHLGENLPEGEYVWLQVSDTGCGMDEQTRTRIFEPFFSTKFTGRGLGMAAVQGIVRSQRGAISVSTKLGLGSTMHVFLPAETAPGDESNFRSS